MQSPYYAGLITRANYFAIIISQRVGVIGELSVLPFSSFPPFTTFLSVPLWQSAAQQLCYRAGLMLAVKESRLITLLP